MSITKILPGRAHACLIGVVDVGFGAAAAEGGGCLGDRMACPVYSLDFLVLYREPCQSLPRALSSLCGVLEELVSFTALHTVPEGS